MMERRYRLQRFAQSLGWFAVCAMASACGGHAPAPQHPIETAGAQQGTADLAGLEARVAKLEAERERYAEALQFLQAVYDQQKQQATYEPAPGAVFAVPVADAIAAGQLAGPVDAPVTLVKAFDFACPYCAELDPVLDSLLAAHPGELRIVYEHLVVHPTAMPAHLGACAAGRQGKYGAFKKAIWEKVFREYAQSRDPERLAENHIVEAARAAGLDVKRLQQDMASESCKARIAADQAQLENFGVRGTPTLFLNGVMLPPGVDAASLESLVAQQVAAVKRSRVPPAQYYQREVMEKGEKTFRSRADAAR